MISKVIKHKKAFGLLEVIIAVAIFLIIATSGLGILIANLSSSSLEQEIQAANLYAQEGLDAITSVKRENWNDLLTGTYGLTNTNGYWELQGISDTQGKYTRQIQISAVERDGSNNIVNTGGTQDPATFKITSTVDWNFTNQKAKTIELIKYLTYWEEPIAITGDWTLPTQAGSFDLPIAGGTDALKVKIDGNYAYVVTESASPNLYILDISDPYNPSVEGSITISGTIFNLSISGNYCYLGTSDSVEIQVVDVSDPTLPLNVGSYDLSGTADVYGVDVSGDRLFVSRVGSSDAEIVIFDISTPATPIEVSSFNYLTTTISELAVVGNFVYFTTNGIEFGILDITDELNPTVSGY
ncbi:MAG: prepilin-type N-terminal cleavage/methylation domain-containing protein, partial [Ignavibacteriae bacterium]|nr:prepilin-type N-terminal cleavage/methylation domain-containing protein [Ignavibacteriota bacterium]